MRPQRSMRSALFALAHVYTRDAERTFDMDTLLNALQLFHSGKRGRKVEN